MEYGGRPRRAWSEQGSSGGRHPAVVTGDRVFPARIDHRSNAAPGPHRLAPSTALVRLDGSSSVGVSLTVNDEFALASSSQEGDHRRVAAHGRP